MEIKRNLLLICSLLFLGCLISGCDSKPVVDLFKKDLKVNVLFKDTDNLSPDSVVYMEKDNEKVNIGSVKKIETSKNGNKIVHLAIFYDYRELINSDTMFVLDSPLIGNRPTSIFAANAARDPFAAPLKSGLTVNGFARTDYSIALAQKGISEWIEGTSEETEKYLEDFKKYVESFDMDKFISQVEDTAEAVSDFSKEQKKKFKKDIFPEIEKLIDDLEKKIEQSGDDADRQKLEREYDKLKDSVTI